MNLDTNDSQSSHEKPQAVDYAPAGTRRPLARRVLRHPLFWVVIIVLLVWTCHRCRLYDWGWKTDVCTQCGAKRQYKFFRLFATTWQYDEKAIGGPISRRIQAHLGQSCKHQWLLSEESSRWIRASCAGLALFLWSSFVEGLPDCDAFLDKQIAKDPMFMQNLIQAVQSPYDHQAWWESLKTEAFYELDLQIATMSSQPSPATSSPASQPASQPAHSAPQ